MKHRFLLALGGGLLVLGSAGCDKFLTGPGIDQDPNNVSLNNQAPGPLYVGVQTAQATQFEGQLARLAAMYTQQIAGVGRQFLGYDIYQSQPTDLDPYWQGVYAGGGLEDLRRIQTLTRASGDSTFAGIAMVWEGLVMGEAASFWGDIPYRTALVPGTKPTFDPQTQVYADVQARLDTAILFLSKSGSTNAGPGSSENIYAGRSARQLRAVYTEVAHTLKARFYMHMAEVDQSNYARAAAQARLGISTPDNDFNFFHSTTSGTENVHYQFYYTRGDVLPGAAIVHLMQSRIAAGLDNDVDRMSFYFTTQDNPANPGDYCGYRPATDPNLPGGADASSTFCDFGYIPALADFHQPMITFAENKLILAEACIKSGCQAEAQSALDAVRQNEVYGATTNGPVTFSSQKSIPATLQNVMEEKYIDLFLNPEVWNDYKRTCLPFLAPAPTTVTGSAPGNEIPGRFPYGLSEINTNGANVPGVSNTGRNRNDPNACPRLTYTSNPKAY